MKKLVKKDTCKDEKDAPKEKLEQEFNTTMPASTAPLIMPQDGTTQRHQPQVFSDEELSEIFQIDFGEIFGSPDEGLKPSKYKGVQLPPPATPASAQKSNINISNRNREEQASTRGNRIKIRFRMQLF